LVVIPPYFYPNRETFYCSLPFVFRVFGRFSLIYLDKDHETLKKLEKSFNSFLSRPEITKYQHWLIYALVEKLRQEGYSVRKSFIKAGELLKLPMPSSVQPRYYERKKEAKKLGMSLNDIIRDKGLSRALIDLLGKLS
jgi:hypothetical protein